MGGQRGGASGGGDRRGGRRRSGKGQRRIGTRPHQPVGWMGAIVAADFLQPQPPPLRAALRASRKQEGCSQGIAHRSKARVRRVRLCPQPTSAARSGEHGREPPCQRPLPALAGVRSNGVGAPVTRYVNIDLCSWRMDIERGLRRPAYWGRTDGQGTYPRMRAWSGCEAGAATAKAVTRSLCRPLCSESRGRAATPGVGAAGGPGGRR